MFQHRRFAVLVALFLVPAARAGARPVNLDRTVFVSPVPGNPVASGARLLTELAAITTAAADNAWLIKIEPGVYDLSGVSLAMKPFVDVEGSGEGSTTIQSTVAGLGTVQGAAHAELRSLTVVNKASNHAVALKNSVDGFTASHVTALASGGSVFSAALSNSAAGTFRDLTLRAEGSPTATGASMFRGLLERVHAFASGASFAYGVFSSGSDGEIVDATAEAVGPSYATAFRNEAGAPLLRNVRAIGGGANISEGIVNGGGSAARIHGAVIDVTGGADFSSGIRNESSSPVVSDAAITVDGAGSAFGMVSLFSGTPALRSVTIRVTGAGSGVGIQADDTEVTVEGSTITSDWLSLRNFGSVASAIRVGASRLVGGVDAGAGTVQCAASYDGSFAALGSNCVP